MNAPAIRPARLQEADALSALALRSKAHWGYSPEFIEACRGELRVPDGNIADSKRFRYRVAHQGERVMGYYAIEKLSDDQWELEALFVDPAFIGQGVGRLLMTDAKALAADLDARELIIQGDPNAEIYLAAGADKTGRRESGSIPGRFLPLFTIRFQHTDDS